MWWSEVQGAAICINRLVWLCLYEDERAAQLVCISSPWTLQANCGSSRSPWQTLHFCPRSSLSFVFEASCICGQGGRVQKSEIQEYALCPAERNKNVKHVVKPTQMTLCRNSSARLSASCSFAIRLWCKVSLRDPIKKWETSWME